MYIPDHKIEEVRAVSDIVDIVGDYVRLKKQGSNYFGLCPFHNEKTPSFSVNPSMGIYKCFGCSKGGNVYQFVMEMESIGFPEAVRMLAERAGIPLPEQDKEREQASEIESIYHALRFTARFFYDQLTQAEAGKPALDYLTGRGFAPKTIKQFGLGYAPDRWDALLKQAEQHHITPEMLEKAGLVLPRKEGDGYYDRFRGRAIFPIFSHVGKVLGFGGRIMTPSPDQPKYINSPETKVYNKSRVLYGLYQAKQGIRKTEFAALVEGYTDVISLHQAGVNNVIATSGTALTKGQISLLGRYAKKVVFIYDADSAGINATLRGADMMFEEGLGVYVVELPKGEDPDSFAREQGGTAFTEYVQANWMSLPAFKLVLSKRDGTFLTPEGRAQTIHSIVESVSYIPDSITRDEYISRLGEAMGIPDIHLFKALDKLLADRKRQKEQKSRREARREELVAAAPRPPDVPPPPTEAFVEEPDPVQDVEPLPQEKILLRLMLEHGSPMLEFILNHMALEEFTAGPAREIVEILLEMYHDEAVETQRFFDGSFSEPVQRLAAGVLVDRYEPSENWALRKITVPRINEDVQKAATSAMTLLKLNRVKTAIDEHKDKMYRASQSQEDLHALQSELMHLLELQKQIERREFLQWNAS